MSFLSYLKDAVVEEIQPSKSVSRTGIKVQHNPDADFIGFRLWKDGSVYPSQTLVEMFDLEYRNKVQTGTTVDGSKEWAAADNVGFGLDLIDSEYWKDAKMAKRTLAMAVVPKDLPKVDLFANTRYSEETGKPLTSVMEQGSAAYAKRELFDLLKTIYSYEIPENEDFVDLKLFMEKNLANTISNGIFLFPKKVLRGVDAGKMDYQRRENVKYVYGIYPAVFDEESTTVITEVKD